MKKTNIIYTMTDDNNNETERLYTTTGAVIFGSNEHIGPITEPNAIHAIKGQIPDLFNLNVNKNLTFELIDHPEILAVMDDFEEIEGGNENM